MDDKIFHIYLREFIVDDDIAARNKNFGMRWTSLAYIICSRQFSRGTRVEEE